MQKARLLLFLERKSEVLDGHFFYTEKKGSVYVENDLLISV